MANGDIAVELTESVIRVCAPRILKKRAETGASFETRFEAAMPDGAYRGGLIRDPQKVGEALKDALAKRGVKPKGVVFSVYADRIAVKDVALPPVAAKKVDVLVQANASTYFPVDLKDYKVGYFTISAPKKKGEAAAATRIMVCATPLVMLDAYAETARAAGLKIRSIDFAANARYQLYKNLNVEGVCLYVDVDVNFTYLTFMQGQNLLLQRTLPFGGGSALTEYMNDSGSDVKQALAALSDEAVVEDMKDNHAVEALDECVDRIHSGVVRSHHVYEGQHAGIPLERAVLCGPCAKLAGLKEAIGRSGWQVDVIDDLPSAKTLFPQINTGDSAGKFAYVFMTTAAAAFAPIGLEPQNAERDEKRRKRAEKRSQADRSATAGFILAGLFVLIGAALVFVAYTDYDEAAARREKLKADILALEHIQATYDEYVAIRDTAISYARTTDALTEAPNSHIRAFFEEMEAKMPSDMLLASAEFTEAGVTMTVSTASKEGAARFIETLRGFESLAAFGVNVTTLAETETMTGSRDSFTITCAYAGYIPEGTDAEGDTTADDIEYLNNFHFKQRSYSFEPGAER